MTLVIFSIILTKTTDFYYVQLKVFPVREGPMKRVIPTPDIAKNFHPTPDTVIFKSTPKTVKYLMSTLDTDPPYVVVTMPKLDPSCTFHRIPLLNVKP